MEHVKVAIVGDRDVMALHVLEDPERVRGARLGLAHLHKVHIRAMRWLQ